MALFEPDDCQGVVDWLYYEELMNRNPRFYEFISPSAIPRQITNKAKLYETPRSYTLRTYHDCSLLDTS